MFRALVTCTVFALAALGSSQQVPFDVAGGVGNGHPVQVGTFSQPKGNFSTRSLASITSENEYLAMGHPRFPAHQVRVKKSAFCDPTVK